MKNKIILLSLSYIFTESLFANNVIRQPIPLTAEQKKAITKIAKAENLPKPDSGITITDKIAKGMPPEVIAKRARERVQQRTQGYAVTNTTRPQVLEHIKAIAKAEILLNKDNKNPTDTNLKAHAAEIKLAFPFQELPMVESKDIIGFAAAGGWDNGWTGIGEFFTDKDLGICSYSVYNLTLVHGGVQVYKENVRYDINNNPNSLFVEQGNNGAFLYSIDWYSNWHNHYYSNELECTTKTYNPKTTQNLINLARKIEKSQQERNFKYLK